MATTLVGYARCSTDRQDLEAQHGILLGLGVAADRIYVDRGLTGTRRARPGLDQALAAVHPGDTLVVPKLDRLARSVPDARGDRRLVVGPRGEIVAGRQPLRPDRPDGMKRRCTGRYPSRADHPAVRHVHRRLVLHSLTPKIDGC